MQHYKNLYFLKKRLTKYLVEFIDDILLLSILDNFVDIFPNLNGY